jgi:hypothetical protein
MNLMNWEGQFLKSGMCYYQKKNLVRTTINIKKENIISAGRVINIDTFVNKDFHSIIKNRVFVKPIE